MKIRAKEKNGITSVTAMAKHIMLPYEAAKTKGVDANFITNWKAKIDGKVVFEMSSSQFVSKNPIVKFKIKGAKKAQEIKMTWVDLAGKTESKTAIIK